MYLYLLAIIEAFVWILIIDILINFISQIFDN